MRRFREHARNARALRVALVSCFVLGGLGGCEQLEARNRVKQGNRLFQETHFIDAVAEYQNALGVVDDPAIHFNLGLAYSKVFKPGFDGPVLLGTQDEFVCQQIPGVKMGPAAACVKPGERSFSECGVAKTAPIEKEIAELTEKLKNEADDEQKKYLKSELADKQDELSRYVCPSSFQCVEATFCSLTSPELADLAAQHFQTWIKAQPNDDELKEELATASKELDEAKAADNASAASAAQKRVDDLQAKDQIRKQMTLLWTDSEQYRKALDYWESLLKDKPNDGEIMGVLAGINLKAGDWRKSTEWYNKVAEVTNDPSSKVAAYQFVGRVAWSKLNSRTLIGAEAVELADRGIGALQHAAEIQPKNASLVSLQASILNFRSTAHGVSWASAIDRASAQDLSKLTRVLVDEAKKAQGQAPGTPPQGAPSPATPPAASATPGTSPAPATPPEHTMSSSTPPATPPAAPATPPAAAPPTPAAPEAAPPTPAAPATSAETPEAPSTAAPATPPAAPATGGPAAQSGG